MSTRLKWLLVVFTLMGAIVGLAITVWIALPFVKQGALSWPIGLILVVVMALYALGGAAAVRFARHPEQRGWLRFYYALQVLALSSPFLNLHFFSGAYLIPTLTLPSWPVAFGLEAWFGSAWSIHLIGGGNAWTVGVNLVAVAVLWLLRNRAAGHPYAPAAQPAADPFFKFKGAAE